VKIEARLAALGLVLPAPLKTPAGMRLPFAWVRVTGHRAILSGHGPVSANGELLPPFGKVGAEVSVEQAQASARATALAMFASLHRELGDLDRVARWLRVFGMVNAAPGFDRMPLVINGCSDLILDVFGPEVGAHARSAVGVAELPMGIPVEIEAEVELS
jgi:enamine deaminase RidA (YjgF/YER057c/UK114 family)